MMNCPPIAPPIPPTISPKNAPAAGPPTPILELPIFHQRLLIEFLVQLPQLILSQHHPTRILFFDQIGIFPLTIWPLQLLESFPILKNHR